MRESRGACRIATRAHARARWRMAGCLEHPTRSFVRSLRVNITADSIGGNGGGWLSDPHRCVRQVGVSVVLNVNMYRLPIYLRAAFFGYCMLHVLYIRNSEYIVRYSEHWETVAVAHICVTLSLRACKSTNGNFCARSRTSKPSRLVLYFGSGTFFGAATMRMGVGVFARIEGARIEVCFAKRRVVPVEGLLLM